MVFLFFGMLHYLGGTISFGSWGFFFEAKIRLAESGPMQWVYGVCARDWEK